jgi:hypothetical protein
MRSADPAMGSSPVEQIFSWIFVNTLKSCQTPLGPPTTWVHILLETLVKPTEYGMRKGIRTRRKH